MANVAVAGVKQRVLVATEWRALDSRVKTARAQRQPRSSQLWPCSATKTVSCGRGGAFLLSRVVVVGATSENGLARVLALETKRGELLVPALFLLPLLCLFLLVEFEYLFKRCGLERRGNVVVFVEVLRCSQQLTRHGVHG